MDSITKIVQAGIAPFGLQLNTYQCNKIERYAQLLIEWNSKINLTAIVDPAEIAVKHFVDSLSVCTAVNLSKPVSLADIGTGAGFPGLALKIAFPDIKLTLIDSLNKRCNFLREVCNDLNIKADILHLRAEEGSHNPKLRENFDVTTARAVAALPLLCEYCLPYTAVGGVFIAMKGTDLSLEISGAANAIDTLGGKLLSENTLILPDLSNRTIISIKKLSHTPTIFPRSPAKIAKKLL